MKRIGLLIITIATVVLMLASCSSKIEKLMTEAEAAINSGDYKSAVELYSEVIDSDDENARAYDLRGYAEYKLGEYDKAVDDCKKAVSLGRTSAYTCLWKSCMKLGDKVNAEKYIKESIESGSIDAGTYKVLIGIYEEQGEYKKARSTKLEAYNNTGDDAFRVIAVSEATAKEKGGIYILSEEMFYPLQEDCEELAWSKDDRNHLALTYPEVESIPYLCSGDKLVLFTDKTLNDNYYCRIGKVTKQGYTVPIGITDYPYYSVSKNKVSNHVWGRTYIFPVFNADELGTEIEAPNISGFSIEDVEQINGMSYNEFYKKYSFKKSCSRRSCEYDDYDEYLDLKYGDSLTFTYHDGSSQETERITADIKYYWYDADKTPKRAINLTDKSYAEIETPSLKDGTYAIQWINDGISGTEAIAKYLFKVGN